MANEPEAESVIKSQSLDKCPGFCFLALSSSLGKPLAVLHDPEPLDLCRAPSRNPPGYQVPLFADESMHSVNQVLLLLGHVYVLPLGTADLF